MTARPTAPPLYQDSPFAREFIYCISIIINRDRQHHYYQTHKSSSSISFLFEITFTQDIYL